MKKSGIVDAAHEPSHEPSHGTVAFDALIPAAPVGLPGFLSS